MELISDRTDKRKVGYLGSWCAGHLVGLAEPDAYDENYKKWNKESLPIIPMNWK